MAEIKNEKYILMPCSGKPKLGILRGHLYMVVDNKGKNELGFATKEAVFKKYGEDDCFISGSDSVCPICFEYNMGTLEEKIELKLIE